MAIKLNKQAFKYHIVAISSSFLALILLLILGYVFFIKRPNIIQESEINGQKIKVSISAIKSDKIFSKTEQENLIEDDNENLNDFIRNNKDLNQKQDLGIAIKDNGQPIITIIIGDLGLSDNEKISLPEEINFGVSSYAENFLNESNNQLLINIPLESNDSFSEDRIPQTLLINDTKQNNLIKLDNILNKYNNYQAVYSSSDERYSSSENAIEFLLENLKQRNLIYLCGIKDKNALIYKIAKKINFPILANDINLDNIISEEAIQDNLIELENIAHLQGNAIAIGSAYPLTIEEIKKWVPTLAEKGIRILTIKDFYETVKLRNDQIAKEEYIDYNPSLDTDIENKSFYKD